MPTDQSLCENNVGFLSDYAFVDHYPIQESQSCLNGGNVDRFACYLHRILAVDWITDESRE